MRVASRWPILFSLLIATACADGQPLNPAASSPDLAITEITSAIAEAVESEAVRSDLLRALRKSPYVEHKLHLVEVLQQIPDLRAAVARGLGVREIELLEYAAANPYDVYFPFSADRLGWDGSVVPTVAHVVNVDGPWALVFDGGTESTVALSDLPARRPALVVHGAEPRSLRFEYMKADLSASRIQLAGEPELGGVLQYTDHFGLDWEVELADLRREAAHPLLAICYENCWPEGGGGGGGGGGSSQDIYNVRLKRVSAYYEDGVGSAEVEWRFTRNGSVTTIRIEGFDHGHGLWEHDVLPRNTVLFAYTTPPSGSISVTAKETDQFSDDDWGTGTVGVGWVGGSGRADGQPLDDPGGTIGFCTDVGDPDWSECHHTFDYGNSTYTTDFTIRTEFVPGW